MRMLFASLLYACYTYRLMIFFKMSMHFNRFILICLTLAMLGCGSTRPSEAVMQSRASTAIYRIGPLDSLEIFIWRMPELSRGVTVRPDGRISVPLIDDLVATGKTPTQLARDIEVQLTKYVQDPTVTVILPLLSVVFMVPSTNRCVLSERRRILRQFRTRPI
jgi:hypothetical protein